MGLFSSFKKAVKSVGSSVKSAVKSAASSVKSAVKSAGTSIKKHAQSFKKDVLNTNVLVSTVGGAISGFASGGIPGAIAGAAGGVVAGREQTLAERREAREAESVGEEYVEDYITENGVTVGVGFADTRSASDVINETLNQVKGTVSSALTPKERYKSYTVALDRSGARGK